MNPSRSSRPVDGIRPAPESRGRGGARSEKIASPISGVKLGLALGEDERGGGPGRQEPST